MTPENLKPNLELRELELKVKELEFNVKELEKPQYKKLSFWSSIFTILIAVGSVIGQSIYSNIKNERANLQSDLAVKTMNAAKDKKDSLDKEIKVYNDSIKILTLKTDTLTHNLTRITQNFTEMTSSLAFPDSNKLSGNSKTNEVITKASNNVSDLLLSNAMQTLLKGAILKVYYTPQTKQKAIEINEVLKSNGVQSDYELPGYNISNAHNEIVYYNDPQLNYCKSVQVLLEKSGKGNFTIRKSSGANATTKFFKIYVVN